MGPKPATRLRVYKTRTKTFLYVGDFILVTDMKSLNKATAYIAPLVAP